MSALKSAPVTAQRHLQFVTKATRVYTNARLLKARRLAHSDVPTALIHSHATWQYRALFRD